MTFQSLFQPQTSRSLRWIIRLSIVGTLISVIWLVQHFLDIGAQYSAGTYFSHSVYSFWHGLPENERDSALTATDGKKGDKIVVMGKVEGEETSWVEEYLPDWQSAIYTVNPSASTPNTTLTTPFNLAHEATPYLTFLIDNYSSLPATLTFLHSHRSGFLKAWHVDTPLHSNVAALRSLNITHVQNQGYVNLRCNPNPGCLGSQVKHNSHITPKIWRDFFEVGKLSYSVKDREGSLGEYPSDRKVGQACCAQFAVSRDRVRERPREDYVKMRGWIEKMAKERKMSDAKSGRVFEFLWQVVFGMGAVFCPEEKQCYCDVYGRC